MFILFVVHQMALGLFGMMACIARDMVLANTFGSAALLTIFLLGGFIVPKGRHIPTYCLRNANHIAVSYLVVISSGMIKPWWIWGYYLSPLTYGQTAITVNEFTATRWMKVLYLAYITY